VADEHDWEFTLNAVSDTETINSALNAAIDILYLFVQGEGEVLDFAWGLPGFCFDIKSGQVCTVNVIAGVLFRLPRGKLSSDNIQEVAVVFNQAGVAGDEEYQDVLVGYVGVWRRYGILDLTGTSHCSRKMRWKCLFEGEQIVDDLGDMETGSWAKKAMTI